MNIRLQLVYICRTADEINLNRYIQSELPVEKYPSTQWIGSFVDPTPTLDSFREEEISCHCLDSNPAPYS